MERIEAVRAAQLVAEERYPECGTVLLAGSVVRGQATATSDLDLVVVTKRNEAPYRESFLAYGWRVEAFVHTWASLARFFASDAQNRIPSLPFMCAEEAAVRDRDGLASDIKTEARAMLAQGPEPPTALTPAGRRLFGGYRREAPRLSGSRTSTPDISSGPRWQAESLEV